MIWDCGSTSAFFTNTILQTAGNTKPALKPSWRQMIIGIIRFALMADEFAHLKIAGGL